MTERFADFDSFDDDEFDDDEFDDDEFDDDEPPLCFADFDSFGDDDLYMVDGPDVWHCDGRSTRQVGFSFSSDLVLANVCCGGDGMVYLSGEGGEMFVGRGDTWHEVPGPACARPFRDLVWFDGRVWAANDDGLWVVEDGTLCSVSLPGFAADCVGGLVLGDEGLIMSGAGGSALFADGEWRAY